MPRGPILSSLSTNRASDFHQRDGLWFAENNVGQAEELRLILAAMNRATSILIASLLAAFILPTNTSSADI